MQPDIISGAIDAIATGAAQYGWLGVLASSLTVGIGVFKYFAPDYWERQKRWVKLSWVFGTSAIGALLLAVLGGVAVPAAVSAALLGGLAAIGGHQVKKSAEEIVTEKRNEKARAMMDAIVKKAPDIKPEIRADYERRK